MNKTLTTVLRVLVGLAFLASGGTKVLSAPPAVELFARIGLGQGFRYITGGLELLGAIGLFFPGTAYYASTLLAAVMVAAIAFHRTVIGGSPVPAIIMLVLCMAIAFLTRAGQRA